MSVDNIIDEKISKILAEDDRGNLIDLLIKNLQLLKELIEKNQKNPSC